MKKFIFLMCLCLLPLSASASTIGRPGNYVSLSSGLVGYWPLDGNTTSWTADTTNDLSGQGNTGQLINMSTTTSPVSGKIGQALNFDGVNDYVTFPYIASAAPPNPVTYCAWTNLKSVPGGFDTFIKNGPSTSNQSYLLQVAGGAPPTQYSFAVWGASYAANGGTIVLNKWVHLCGTFDGTTMVLYVNGVSVASDNTGTVTAPASTPGFIGATATSPGSFDPPATIDDVRIYNRTLSASEVQALYNIGAANVAHSNTAALASGLVGYWPLDGNTTNWTADTTNDLSGQGNTGRLVSLATSTAPVGGKVGQALRFNGSASNVKIADATSLQVANVKTVAFWFNSSNLSQVFPRIVEEVQDASNAWSVAIRDPSQPAPVNTLEADFFKTGARSAMMIPAGSLAVNTWYHAVIEYNGSVVSHIYLNGVDQTLTSDGTGVLHGTSPLMTIGMRADNQRWFKGSIDDVRVYNRLLSSTEVQELYNLGADIGHSNAGTNAPLSSGLIGYWPLDGNTTNWTTNKTNDLSGQGNTGQLISMSTSTSPVPGKIGGALYFIGTSSASRTYVNLGNLSSGPLVLTGSMTIAAWVKPASLANLSGQPGYIVCKVGFSRAYGFFLNTDGTIGLQIATNSSTITTRSSAAKLSTNKWYHVVGVYNASAQTIDIYVNGVISDASLSGSVPSSQFSANSQPVFIGARNDFSTLEFEGSIDDVRMYNRALSAGEVQELYGAGR